MEVGVTTKAAAIQSFLGSFGLDAYASTSVPDGADFPYITYNLVDGAWGDGEQAMQVDIWYYGGGEAAPNAKVQEISDAIGIGGVTLQCDAGLIWVKRGSPFAQSVADGSGDDSIKRRYLNIDLEYFTAH